MKIGILTFHCAHNYGAVLQCYALQEILKSMGHDVEVINYRPEYLLKPYRIFDLGRFKHKNPLKLIKAILKEIILFRKRVARHNIFQHFINERLNLSNEVSREQIPSYYDVYIMGSDQIWNPKLTKGFDPVYFGCFDFKKGRKKYVAYAASMEAKTLSFQEKEFYKRVLDNFDAISVRETQLAEQLRQLTEKEIKVVLDPTLLADRAIWNKIAKTPKIDKKYILVYQVRDNINTIRIAQDIARQLNVKIVELAAWLSPHFDERRLQCASPEEFLGLIRNATCIITTSFHGTAFSVIFNRPFYCIELRDGQDTRSRSFLNSINLGDRMIKKEDSPKFSFIDYSAVNDNLAKICVESKHFFAVFENFSM